MISLLILLARRSNAGAESILPQSVLIALFFLALVAHYGAKEDHEEIPIVIFMILFLAPLVLLFIDQAYAISAMFGMLCGLFFAAGIKNINR